MEQVLKWFGVVCVLATALSAFLSTVGTLLPEGPTRVRVLWLRDRLDALGLDLRKLGPVAPKLALLVVLSLPLTACSTLRSAGFAPMASAPSPERCATLSDRASTWSAIAGGSALLAGGGGLAIIPTESSGARLAIAIGSVAVGALAAASQVVSSRASSQFVAEGCAK